MPHEAPILANIDATSGGNPSTPSDHTLAANHPAEPRTCRPRQTYASTLRSLSGRMRSRIWQAYQALGGTRGRLNDQRRAILSEAIFQIENDLEHRQPDHPTVRTLRAIRNRLYDDLRWNEYPRRRQPQGHVHAA
jgi:hypothetical protein